MSAVDQLVTIAAIALGFLVVAVFYESLATRDVYVGRVMAAARRLTARRPVLVLVYLATVGIGIPALLLVWALVLAVALLLVGSLDRAENVGLVAVYIVGAARVLAYARERSAQDLAKAVPLALVFLLISGGALDIEAKAARLTAAPASGLLTQGLLLVLVALELGLRITTDVIHVGLAEYRRRRGIDSDLGLWRSVWTVVRRPMPKELFEPGGAAGRGPEPRGEPGPPDDGAR